jgi:hypothetical protein
MARNDPIIDAQADIIVIGPRHPEAAESKPGDPGQRLIKNQSLQAIPGRRLQDEMRDVEPPPGRHPCHDETRRRT